MVLFGVQRVFLQEIDPVTKLPFEGSAEYVLKCAESVNLEPVVEEGEESILKCPSNNAILANRLDNDTFIGYDVTLTDNEWNAGVMALVNGFETVADADTQEITTLITPMIENGMNFKPFRMVIFAAAYEGKDIARYVVFVLNSCTGSLSTIDLGQDWVQFEYNIKAREATAAGFPVMSVGYYTAPEAPDTLDDITITSGVIQPGAPADEDEEGNALKVKIGNTTATTAKVTAATQAAKETKEAIK